MTCCEDQDFNCHQGRDCIKRRRVRAGQPPKVELWINDDDYAEQELPPWKAGVFVAGIIVVIGLFALGWVAVL